LNVYELREIYSKEFKSLSYKFYLTRLLNQEIAIQYNNKKGFKIDEDIENHYLSMNINDFLNFYCMKTSKDRYTLKLSIPKNQRSSILYFLFIKNFQISFDDYIGRFFIKKFES